MMMTLIGMTTLMTLNTLITLIAQGYYNTAAHDGVPNNPIVVMIAVMGMAT